MSESDTMFNERNRICAAVQVMHSTDPSYDNRTIASTLKMHRWINTNNRDVPMVMKTKFPATVMVFGVVSSEDHIMPPHIFEVGLKVNTRVYLDLLKSVVIPWCNQVASGRPWVCSRTRRRPTSPKRSRLGFRRNATTFYPSLTSPPPPSTWTHWTTSFGHTSRTSPHQSQPDRRHPPSIRRAPTGACGKGMLPVLDPYRGGDWGWRRLHWIGCHLYYIIKLPEIDFFNKILKIKL